MFAAGVAVAGAAATAVAAAGCSGPLSGMVSVCMGCAVWVGVFVSVEAIYARAALYILSTVSHKKTRSSADDLFLPRSQLDLVNTKS